MKNNNQYIDVNKLDKIIDGKYSASYMNNTKWNKLIQKLTDQLDQIYVNYKLIHSDQVKGNMFITPDFEPFFIEPILYKEIEWIEIPKQYEDWKNENNRKAGKQLYSQNLELITEVISGLGQYEIETNENSITLYGYK